MAQDDMDGMELFEACLGQATGVVKQVRSTHFANATPDAEWNVRDLIGHMLHKLQEMPSILEGEPQTESDLTYDAELVGDDSVELSANWQSAVDAAEMALEDADAEDIARLTYGSVIVDEYLAQLASDLLIHSWDLGKAIGVPVKFDNTLAEIIYRTTAEHKQEFKDSGLFSKELEVVGNVDIQTRLLALFGRRADWQAV